TPPKRGIIALTNMPGEKVKPSRRVLTPGTDRTPELLTPGRLYQGGTDHESPRGSPRPPKAYLNERKLIPAPDQEAVRIGSLPFFDQCMAFLAAHMRNVHHR